VVVLKIWSGLTYETIGQVLSIPLGTAQSRYRYAVQAMRQRLAESP
jgi:RNA polymerase sigma-70 factor (ECF subfamily)